MRGRMRAAGDLHMIDETHAADRRSWVGSANGHAMFPIQNLPLGVFAPEGGSTRGGVAIGDSIFDIGAYSLDKGTNGKFVLAFGQEGGQFWDAFDDWKQDVTGRLRWTAQTKANIDTDAGKFLHLTWSVSTVSTAFSGFCTQRTAKS